MTRSTMKPFRQKELDGGINLSASPNEIENKQCIDAVNFNVDGNKLISMEGNEENEILGVGTIQGFTVDEYNKYYIKDGILYKDLVAIESKNGVKLRLTGLKVDTKKEVLDENGDLVTKVVSSTEYFPDGVFFYIDIDGTTYKTEGNSRDDVYNSLILQLNADGYSTAKAGDYLYITSDTPIVVTTTGFDTTVIYMKTIVSGEYFTNSSPKIIRYKINGVDFFYYNTEKTGVLSASDLDLNIITGLKDKLSTELPNGIDLNIGYLSPNFQEDGTGTLVGYQDVNGYACIILSNYNNLDIGISSGILNGIWIKDSVNLFSSTNYFVVGGVTITFPLSGVTDIATFDTWLLSNGYSKTIKGGGFDTYSGSYKNSNVYFFFSDNNEFKNVTSGIFGPNMEMSRTLELNMGDFPISTNDFTNEVVISEISNQGLYDITVGNTGSLLINRNGGASYYTDNVIYKLASDAVGEPTVGTIYQGKVILGGYPNNDNIVFSQTSDLTYPLRTTIFNAYNAGGQSISGGNKSKLTGFSVGENGLYAFKEDEVWYTNSDYDNPTSESYNYIFRKITSNGALSQSVITPVGQDIFYLDWKNRAVRRLSYEQNLTTLRDTAISDEIRSLLTSLPAEQPLATATYSYPNYKIYLTDGTSELYDLGDGKTYHKNNISFTYNVSNKSWFKESIEDVIFSDSNIIIKDDNKAYEINKGFKSNGSFLSKEYDMGDATTYKRFGQFEIYGEIDDGMTLFIDIYEDGGLYDTFEINNSGIFRSRFDFFIEGRVFQFGLRYEGTGKLEINEFTIFARRINTFDEYQG